MYACICVVAERSFMLSCCHLSLTLWSWHCRLTADFHSQPLPLYLPPDIFYGKRSSLLRIVEEKKITNYLLLILVYFVLTVTSSVL